MNNPNPEELSKKKKALLSAITRYTKWYNEDSWKGGGDPDAVPEIERQLKMARINLLRTIDRTVV